MKSPLTAAPALAVLWVSGFPQKDSEKFTEKSVIYYIEKMEFISSIQQKPITAGKRQKLHSINEAGGRERVIHRQIKQTNHVPTLFCCVLLGVSGFILALKEKRTFNLIEDRKKLGKNLKPLETLHTVAVKGRNSALWGNSEPFIYDADFGNLPPTRREQGRLSPHLGQAQPRAGSPAWAQLRKCRRELSAQQG